MSKRQATSPSAKMANKTARAKRPVSERTSAQESPSTVCIEFPSDGFERLLKLLERIAISLEHENAKVMADRATARPFISPMADLTDAEALYEGDVHTEAAAGQASATDIRNLQSQTQTIRNGEVFVSRNQTFVRTRKMLEMEKDFDFQTDLNDISDSFPPHLDADVRAGMRGLINLAYFSDVGCDVSNSALRKANTPEKLLEAIFSAITRTI